MKHNPTRPGTYTVRINWTVHGKLCDEWCIKQWDGKKWNVFSGCRVIDWRKM